LASGSRSRTIIQFMLLFLIIYFVQYAVVPFIAPDLTGSPTSWVITAFISAGSWIVIKMLLWNVKRERVTL